MVFTANDARMHHINELDDRIERAVRTSETGNSASIRVYCEDWFCRTIREELVRRGFKNIEVPDITIKGDVYFEW